MGSIQPEQFTELFVGLIACYSQLKSDGQFDNVTATATMCQSPSSTDAPQFLAAINGDFNDRSLIGMYWLPSGVTFYVSHSARNAARNSCCLTRRIKNEFLPCLNLHFIKCVRR